MKKLTGKYSTRNDLFRYSGLGLIVWGQFLPKDVIFNNYGFDGNFNLIQITGFFAVILLPAMARFYDLKKKQ